LWALALGGVGLIVFEKWYAKKEGVKEEGLESITKKQALAIGLFQSIAMVPGISRSAATILGGLFLGIGRKTIVEFSFLLAVPTQSS
jgi:undecaprenyl-diphosphatase